MNNATVIVGLVLVVISSLFATLNLALHDMPWGRLTRALGARRRERWDLAVAVWEELAEIGEPSAMEHLAKYFEHERKDYPRALEATARLIARDPADRHHRRRDARLRARIARRQC